MSIEDLLYNIRLQVELYRSKNRGVDVCIVISTYNLGRLVENTKQTTNIKMPEIVSEIKLFGCQVIPSDFINNESIIVSKIEKL